MSYYMGLDNGGTTTKAALFDDRGRELAVASRSAIAITPGPGLAERDMEALWNDNCAVIRECISRAQIAPDEVAGLGICGHGKGLYLWGKDGRPVRNAILSTDNRAYAYPLRWQTDGTQDLLYARTCQQMMSCQPIPLLAWLREHEPQNYQRIRWIFSCKDYVRFRLTGAAHAEYTDSSGNGLLNLRTRTYDREILNISGMEELQEALPPLVDSTQICAAVTEEAAAQCGLQAGTPVIGGMFDIDACALGVGLLDEDTLCMIAGTWSINEYIRRTPVMDGSVRMNSLFCLPEYYLVEESSPTSAGNNEWFLKQLLPDVKREAQQRGENVYDVMNRWVESVPAEKFVPVFLPFLMASNVHPNARGTFVGLSANHTRKDLLRSVYEGISFCHRDHMERLNCSRDQKASRIRLAGGAARSHVWTQIFADVCGLPVETVTAHETGALGCAIAVAAATGRYRSLEEAAEAMCHASSCVEPDPEKMKLYDEKYRLYQKTIACLDPLWDTMQALIERGDGYTG